MINISMLFGSLSGQKSTVRVISGCSIKEYPVQIAPKITLEKEDGSLTEAIEKIIFKLEEHLKLEKHIELFRKNIPLNSGGLNGTCLAADLVNLGNGKKLFLSLNRRGDTSANTCAIYWIKCPEKMSDEFRNFLRNSLEKNIIELCADLYRRATIREKVIPFYREARRNLVEMN